MYQEFNHYGSGDINVTNHIEAPRRNDFGGAVFGLMGLGCAAVLTVQLIEAAAAYVAAHALAIGGATLATTTGAVALRYRRNIAALLPEPKSPAMPVIAPPQQPVAELPAAKPVEAKAYSVEVHNLAAQYASQGSPLTPQQMDQLQSIYDKQHNYGQY